VVLTRQFRLPVFVSGHGDGLIIELAGGLVEEDTPAQAARREVEEETGYRLSDVQKVFTAYMAPGVISERVHFFVAALDGAERLSSGGGCKEEGEDLGVVELPFDEAIALVAQGEIVDGRTILLLQYAQLQRLV
jgi:nudix-type nucleoside diphosphatase (YffH/AdpP family)